MADPQIANNILKRKRSSPSISSSAAPTAAPPPPQKAPKTSGALQINYLARQSPNDLPLLNKNETIPSILDVLSAYSSVLDRHESLASNLGARPLGPILIKRFERCFDAPPEIIASHSHAKDTSETPQVTWLEVIQFAQSHPGQFTLSTFSEGRRVCQFYFPQKQVRVQVTEEDFLFIKSGRCQDLIPPLPIWEDEEKEVGTCEILEKQLRELTNAADTVAARTRQLSHRLKGRRMAIMERRAGEKTAQLDSEHESGHEAVSPDTSAFRTSTSASGFTAVNGQTTGSTNATVNGEPTAPVAVRSELLRHFQSLSQNQPSDSPRRQSLAPASSTAVAAASPTRPVATPAHRELSPPTHPVHQPRHDRPDPLSYYLSEPAPPPPPAARAPSHGTPGGPTSKHNFSRPLAPGQEISQPFRSICQAHMESLPRGSRVIPPCDRCRRLKMDCLKNLTSCQGCTKKHARCHWREVERGEVEGLEGFSVNDLYEGGGGMDGSGGRGGDMYATSNGAGSGGVTSPDGADDDSEDEGMGAVEDLEALSREEDGGQGHEDRGATARYRLSGGYAEDRKMEDRQVAATGGVGGVAETIERPRDVFSSGLPYSNTPVTTSTAGSHATAEQQHSRDRVADEKEHHHQHPSVSARPEQSAPAATITSQDTTAASMPTSQQQQHHHQTNGFRSAGFTSVNSAPAQPSKPASPVQDAPRDRETFAPREQRAQSPYSQAITRSPPTARPVSNGSLSGSIRPGSSSEHRERERDRERDTEGPASRTDTPHDRAFPAAQPPPPPQQQGVSVGGATGWRGA